MGPVLVLPMLYVAYFFPARYAWPLALLEVLTYASPLLTTSDGSNHLLVSRAFSYAVAYAGLVLTIQFLKRRLVAAERHQHRMARVDPLTGLENRRAFDEALGAALATGTRFTLLLADVDSFKQINDRFGHTTGDRVLRELAAHASEAVRGGDCLARIGGDEIALVAPGAGSDAARRLATTLRDAVARVEAGGEPVSMTVSYAVYPENGTDRFTLMRTLDRQLHARKDALRA
jgi:diguanylate cyclase (GGDEF)-like protein